MQKILWLPNQNDEGIEVEVTTINDCLNEIAELRNAIKSILTDLEKFKGMKAYTGETPLSKYENKYIEDAVCICENQLNIKYVANLTNA